MVGKREGLPEEVVEVELDVLARMLRMADAHTDNTPLIEESTLSKTDLKFLSNLRYCIERLSRNVAEVSYQEYQSAMREAVSSGDQNAIQLVTPPPEYTAFFGGILAGINAGWHQFGSVNSLFPAIGEIAEITGIGRDFAPAAAGRTAWIEAATFDLADFGTKRFNGMEPYYEKVQLAFSPSGEHNDYVRRGIGLGMLIYEEATKFQTQTY